MTIINRVNGFRVNAKTVKTNSFYGYKGITEKEYGRIVKKLNIENDFYDLTDIKGNQVCISRGTYDTVYTIIIQ